MESFIKTEKLVFGYPTENNAVVNVLNGIDLNINRGEFVAILGHNGCGKSTISETFNAMLSPTSGKVIVSGMDTSVEKNVYEIRKKVGLVLQNPENQIIAGIVEEDVAFGPENIGVDPEEIRRRVDEALKVVEMYEYRRSSPYKLSGGQKQRVSIAGAIAMRPDCIVFDEPTSMLDPLGRDEVISTIKKLKKELGMTIILITHFMDEAIEADRVVIMSKGKILTQGTPRQIFSDIDMLKKNSLDVPQATELVERLRASGVVLPRTVLTVDECIAVLSERIKKTKISHRNQSSEENNKVEKPKICFENVSFYYGKGTPFEKQALNNINISISEGDFIGVIGHTGSGKSTFVQHLNGLFKPSSGRVLFDGKDINESRETAREVRFKVGLVFQYPEHQLFEDTVYDDIAFGPKNMKLSKNEIDSRVMSAIEFVGLDRQILTQSPFDISGGEKRRVAIAGIIAMDPDVLVLDEPTAGLDPYGKTSLLEKIKSYHKIRKNTVIMVSHNMEDIARVANKIIVMSDGKVKMFDHTKSVFSQVSMLEDMGLRVPQITKITSELKSAGADLRDGIIDVDTAVYEIKRLIDVGRF